MWLEEVALVGIVDIVNFKSKPGSHQLVFGLESIVVFVELDQRDLQVVLECFQVLVLDLRRVKASFDGFA